MASVIDYIDCKKCGREAVVDFDCRTGEEFMTCKSCGAGYTIVLKRDKEGKPLVDKDGKYMYDYSEAPGNGVAYIMLDNRVASIHIAPENIEEYDDWYKVVLKEIEDNPNIVKEECYVTKWDTEKNELAVVYGKLPDYLSELFDNGEYNDFEQGNEDEYEDESDEEIPF